MRGRIVALACLAAAGILPAPAAARGLERFRFAVAPASGRVRQTWTAAGPAANAPPALPASAGRGRLASLAAQRGGPGPARWDSGAVVIRDAAGAERARVPLARTATEWVPWSIMTDDTAVFAWRVPSGAPAPQDYRDVWTAVDLAGGGVLWRRDVPWHDPAGAAVVDGDTFVVDGWQEVELVELRTGRTVQQFAKRDGAFSVTALDADRLVVEAGDELHLLSRHDHGEGWTLGKRGALVSWTPLPGGDALVQTGAALYRIDARRGAIRWRSSAASPSPLWVVGGRIYQVTVRRSGADEVDVGLVADRLSDGARVATQVVQRYRRFSDLADAWIADVRNGAVTVDTRWIILD